MKKLLLVASCLYLWTGAVYASPLTWDIPGGIGTIGLPFQATEALLGHDFVLKQNIAGASLPVLNIKNVVYGQVGAVGVFKSQSPNVQPYLAVGADILRFIPALNQFKSVHLNGFGRWATDIGRPGAGVSVSYSFGQ